MKINNKYILILINFICKTNTLILVQIWTDNTIHQSKFGPRFMPLLDRNWSKFWHLANSWSCPEQQHSWKPLQALLSSTKYTGQAKGDSSKLYYFTLGMRIWILPMQTIFDAQRLSHEREIYLLYAEQRSSAYKGSGNHNPVAIIPEYNGKWKMPEDQKPWGQASVW